MSSSRTEEASGRATADQQARAFTIVEMIVVVGIISALVAILLPALSGAKSSARLTNEMAAARQLMIAYAAYSDSNRDYIMPGFAPDYPAFGLDRKPLTSGISSQAYTWRLAPFLDYQMRGIYLNDQADRLDELDNDDDYYRIALYPSLGLNATWMGGHSGNYAFDEAITQVFPRFWVERLSEVRRPEEMIVFASARQYYYDDPGAPPTGVVNLPIEEGWHEIRSPLMFEGQDSTWAPTYREALAPSQFGNLSLRHTDRAVAAMVDGHVDAIGESDLRDMRRWANAADAADWTLEPLP